MEVDASPVPAVDYGQVKLSKKYLDKATVAELKQLCVHLDCKQTGNKAELVERVKPLCFLKALSKPQLVLFCGYAGVSSVGNSPALIEQLAKGILPCLQSDTTTVTFCCLFFFVYVAIKPSLS
jgi:hypothetical protein